MELHEISLKETFDLLIDSIINNKERPVFYYKRLNYETNNPEFIEITEIDLMDSRFKTIDCDFSEYEWELIHSNIYIKRGNTNETN